MKPTLKITGVEPNITRNTHNLCNTTDCAHDYHTLDSRYYLYIDPYNKQSLATPNYVVSTELDNFKEIVLLA